MEEPICTYTKRNTQRIISKGIRTRHIYIIRVFPLCVNMKGVKIMSKQNKKRSIGHIRKLSDNKYLIRLSLGYDDFGKRIQPSKVVECSSDREAEKLMLEFYNDREHLKQQHNSFIPQTLGQLYNDWYKLHVLKNLSPKTASWYKNLWEVHISYASELRLEVAAPAHILKIIDAADGARTKHAIYKMLNVMFNKAVKWDYINSNPCSKIDTPKYSAPEKKVLTEKEILLACEKVTQEEIKYQAIFYFALLCSMRRQEILGLKWSDIDYKHNEFIIKRAAIKIEGEGTVAGKTKTEKSKRSLFLPDILKDILLKLKKEQNEIKAIYGDLWIDENWIFTQQDGHLMNLDTPTQWWKKFADKCNIENITFHGLRHTAATHMIRNNVPISTVSGVLGHANISTTLNTYTHVIEDTKKIAINIMADIVNGNIQNELRLVQ